MWLVGQRLFQRELEIELGERTVGVELAQQVVAFRFELGAPSSRMDQRGSVGQYREHRRLRPRQPIRRAPEIAPRRGLEPHDVAAERSVASVEREDLVLVVAELETKREHDLDELLGIRTLGRTIGILARETYHLHRQRTGAAYDFAVDDVEVQRTAERPRVDTVVLAEPLVLERAAS